MPNQTTARISPEEVQRQNDLCLQIARLCQSRSDAPLLAQVQTYGCQQNEADSERLRGYLAQMGFGFTDDPEKARIIVINTCAIRDHAERKILGNVGALVHTKRRHPEQLVCLCGCMAQEPEMAEKIKKSFRHVDLVFGPQALWRFPEFVHTLLTRRGRIFEVADEPGSIAEGIPAVRQDPVKAWVSVMYGCNNFCSYCIVPYVRGRERSRLPEDIVSEVRELVEHGCRDVTLLGQNVNSYGKDLESPLDFADLLAQINDIPGDFLIRFMTSHPKDATQKLFETMARCEKVAPVLHLPVQAGSDRILKAMNRHYDRARYLDEIRRLRSLIPDIVLTSDVIVGFPGETAPEFEETLSLLEEVRFDALFTFLYSPRPGTPAALLEDPMPREEKMVHFNRLVELQNRISAEKHAAYLGTVQRCLVDGVSDDGQYGLTARTPGNRLVRLNGPEELIGQFVPVKITGANTWSLFGQPQ